MCIEWKHAEGQFFGAVELTPGNSKFSMFNLVSLKTSSYIFQLKILENDFNLKK